MIIHLFEHKNTCGASSLAGAGAAWMAIGRTWIGWTWTGRIGTGWSWSWIGWSGRMATGTAWIRPIGATAPPLPRWITCNWAGLELPNKCGEIRNTWALAMATKPRTITAFLIKIKNIFSNWDICVSLFYLDHFVGFFMLLFFELFVLESALWIMKQSLSPSFIWWLPEILVGHRPL